MNIALVTAIYGGYDTLHPLPAGHGFDDAVCVTDDPMMAADGWRTVVEPHPHMPPRLAAKQAKCQPWRYTPMPASVWIDGSAEVTGPGLRAAADHLLPTHDLVVFAHPEPRHDAYEEAEFCRDWPKYAGWPIREQMKHYRKEGLPVGSGLWACGVIGRRHTRRIQRFGDEWLDEQMRWSIQDQLSFPYLVWRDDLTVRTWGPPLWGPGNPWIRWHAHGDGT